MQFHFTEFPFRITYFLPLTALPLTTKWRPQPHPSRECAQKACREGASCETVPTATSWTKLVSDWWRFSGSQIQGHHWCSGKKWAVPFRIHTPSVEDSLQVFHRGVWCSNVLLCYKVACTVNLDIFCLCKSLHNVNILTYKLCWLYL